MNKFTTLVNDVQLHELNRWGQPTDLLFILNFKPFCIDLKSIVKGVRKLSQRISDHDIFKNICSISLT
jgi:hypothetical protein